MTPQTVRHDGDTRTAARGVPAPRAADNRATGTAAVPDPLVGPPVENDTVAPGPRQADGAVATTRTREAGAYRVDPRHDGHLTGPDLHDVPTGELVKRLSTQLSELVRRELELARAELTAKGKRAGTGAGLAGTGGVVALYGLGALIAAAVAALALVMPVWLSALIVGAVLLLVAGVLALAGRSQLRRATPPVPEEAVESVHRDVETVKVAVQHR